jgi:DNA-binding protein H-NS
LNNPNGPTLPESDESDALHDKRSISGTGSSAQDTSTPDGAVVRTRRLDFSADPPSKEEERSREEEVIPPTQSIFSKAEPTPEDPESSSAGPTEANDDLANLSIEELQERHRIVERQISEKKAAQHQAIIDQIVEVVHNYNIPTEELFRALGARPPKRKVGPAKPQYRDPETGSTWSGRGKEPAWIRGKDRAKFRIL